MKLNLGEWSKRHAERLKNRGPDYDTVSSTFSITVAQEKQVDEWYAKHRAGDDCKFKKSVCPLTGEPFYMGAIGGGLSFHFTGTSVGEVVKASCACGAEVDVSDYDSW